jgi:hypothetical protein
MKEKRENRRDSMIHGCKMLRCVQNCKANHAVVRPWTMRLPPSCVIDKFEAFDEESAGVTQRWGGWQKNKRNAHKGIVEVRLA